MERNRLLAPFLAATLALSSIGNVDALQSNQLAHSGAAVQEAKEQLQQPGIIMVDARYDSYQHVVNVYWAPYDQLPPNHHFIVQVYRPDNSLAFSSYFGQLDFAQLDNSRCQLGSQFVVGVQAVQGNYVLAQGSAYVVAPECYPVSPPPQRPGRNGL